MTPGKIRVLVVDDSLTVRKHIVEVLSAQPDLEVVGEASDGKDAVEKCRTLRPSVVTLDMALPVMDGLAATEAIMAYFPTPILIVSASFNRGELLHTYEALRAGAVDVLDKPNGDRAADDGWEERLVASVRMVSRIKVITHPRARLASTAPPSARQAPGPVVAPRLPSRAAAPQVIGIGASTGGPGAVHEVLRGLTPRFRPSILLCIHIAEPFGASLAEWLDGLIPLPVVTARHGDIIASARGKVLMAPAGQHLVVRDGVVELHRGPPRHSCRPSIDLMFESIAASYGPAAVGCLLTGMGRDGAAGLRAIRDAGGLTFAQDEATSVVYGMPREAAQIGAAAHVLPLPAIGPALARLQPEVGGV